MSSGTMLLTLFGQASSTDWKLVAAAVAAGSAVISALTSIASAIGSRRSAATAEAALHSSIRPILTCDGSFEEFADQLQGLDTGLPGSGNALRVANSGPGPALNVIATSRLYSAGFASAEGVSRPAHVPAGEEQTLYIFQEPPYAHAIGTHWEVRITYQDANGAEYWAALDYGRRELVRAESGSGAIPRRFRWFEKVASWENGPTVTYGFMSRQGVRFGLASQRLARWFEQPRAKPLPTRSWHRTKTLPGTLRHLLRGPDEWQDGEPLRRGIRRTR